MQETISTLIVSCVVLFTCVPVSFLSVQKNLTTSLYLKSNCPNISITLFFYLYFINRILACQFVSNER